jgi:hypothetical protein
MKRSIFLLILLIQAVFSTAQKKSPSSFGKKVKYMPKVYEMPSDKTRTADHGGRTSVPWIVFSDEADNFSTTSPGGSLVMKKLNFMEPFYVSAEKNGFVKLIQYKAGVVKGRKLADKKSAVSYGWIAKSRLLLWQRSFSNPQSGYTQKAIAVISGSKPLTEPALFYDDTDSAYVYNSPELKKKISKIRLNEISYIFKKSEDGRKYLIGNDNQFVIDSAAKAMLGWVSTEVVHNWGDRLYISSSKTGAGLDDSVSVTLKHVHADPLLDTSQIILRSAPVIGIQQNGYVLAVANDVYDKSKNEIIAINGNVLSYQNYLDFRKGKDHINIVFVVDGGSSMMKHFASMNNAIQSFERIFNEYSTRHRINYGAVVYRSSSGCSIGGVSSTQALLPDYRNVTRMMTAEAKKTDSCIGIIVEQPLYDGLKVGLDLFRDHKNETNLLILMGSTGNASASGYGLDQLTADFAERDARLLAVQAYSDFNLSFNNFVLQSRMLISNAAVLSAQKKKSYLVADDGLGNTQDYNVSQRDSVSYYLDYPRNSLIQGGVVFPTKGAANSRTTMSIAVRRLMKETDLDIYHQIKSLDSAFRLTGISHENLMPLVSDQLSPPVSDQVADKMPHNTFKYYTTSQVPADIVSKNRDLLQYAVVLNAMEYKQVNDIFSLMTGENLEADRSSFRKKLLRNYFDIERILLAVRMSKHSIKSMTLAGYIRSVTGLPLAYPLLDKYKVADLRREGRMPRSDFEKYIRFIKLSGDRIKANTLSGQQFLSNGKLYYYITEQNFSQTQEELNQQRP